VTDKLGAQGTVCAGGRYNGLVEQLGGKSTPAVGFAMGVERLVLLLETLNVLPCDDGVTDIYITSFGSDVTSYALTTAEALRNKLPNMNIVSHCGGGSFKSQMKKADKSGASIALIIGDDELASQQVTVKYLREHKPQQSLSIDELIVLLTNH